MTLWAVYTQIGTVTPVYSTNLDVTSIDWLSIPVFSNAFVSGTNVFTFDPQGTNVPAVMYQLRQNL